MRYASALMLDCTSVVLNDTESIQGSAVRRKSPRAASTTKVLAAITVAAFLAAVPHVAAAEGVASYVVVPVRINLQYIARQINAGLPAPLANLDANNVVCVPAHYLKTKGPPDLSKCKVKGVKISCPSTWIEVQTTPQIKCDLRGKVEQASDLAVTGNGSTLLATLPVKAKVTVIGPLKLQETAEAAATLSTAITPLLDPEWRLSAKASLAYHWDKKPTIYLLDFVKITVADKVEPEVDKVLVDLQKEAQAKLAQFNFRGTVQKTWDDLQRPLIVSKSPPAYSRFVPESVFFAGLDSDKQFLNTTIGISGYTQLTLGQPPRDITPVPLARLSKTPPVASGFNIELPAFLPYAELERLAHEKFPGGYPAKPGESEDFADVLVKDLRVRRGDDGRLVISVSASVDNRPQWLRRRDWFSGMIVRGDLSFAGTPYIETATRSLAVRDLRYTSATNAALLDALVKIAGIEPIRSYVQERLRYDFGPELDEAMRNANASFGQLSSGPVTVESALIGASVRSLQLRENDLVVTVRANGKVAAEVGL